MVDSITQKGANALAFATKRLCGQTVTFQRGSNPTLDVTAVIGETPFRTDDETGASIISRSRDFIVDAADLVDSESAKIEPKRGDVIVQADGDELTTGEYVVSAPAGEPCFRYVDPGLFRIRIHTIRADTETV